ncbi:MAG: carboxypeptidase regulatory-like domain-containing protein [Bacteroidia bacterium]|nr:carboxypeptidase regulatory-like domain-containing protein [Bacteroidia bacterium]
MLRKLFAVVALSGLMGLLFAQQDAGKVRGVVRDKVTREPLGFATVVLLQNGVVKGGVNTNENGEYSIAPVSPGTYDVRASYAGKTFTISGVVVTANRTIVLDINMESSVETETQVIVDYKVPLFEKDETVTGKTITIEQIQKMGTRNINTFLATSAGVYQVDDKFGAGINVRGARGDATQYFIDGVRVIGTFAMPQRGISQLSVYTGGIPAEFGDVMGGVVQITTGAPSAKHTFGGEIQSSQFTDPYKFNLFAFNASGPVISRTNAEGLKTPILGYAFTMEYQRERDYDPPYGGVYRVKPDLLEDLRQTPLQPFGTGRAFFVNRANFVAPEDIESIRYRQGATLRQVRANLRADLRLGENAFLKFGFGAEDSKRDLWSLSRSLLAYDRVAVRYARTLRGFARLQQTFPGDTGSFLQNFFYTLQFDYTRFDGRTVDPEFNLDWFRYGHIGRFQTQYAELLLPTLADGNLPVYQTAGYVENNYLFDPSISSHPVLANYNTYIYNYLAQNPRVLFNPATLTTEPSGRVRNFIDLLQLGGNVNGLLGAQTLIYNLYFGQGYIATGGPTFDNTDMFRVTGQASAELGRHNFKVGFEFDQRYARFYQVFLTGSNGLWNLMRLYANRHLSELDLNNPIISGDTIRYLPLYQADQQSYFDKKMREKLGLPVDGRDFIDPDAMDPSFFNLRMFDINDLFAGGNPAVFYQGYTPWGERARRVAPERFFTDKENRPQNAFAPTYVALYLQDKFEFDKMFFNLGLRVDRFDANLPVLKDPYIIRPFYRAEETARLLGVTLPQGVGGDWVAYVDNALNPTRILGFRNQNVWYDASGAPTSALAIIRASGGRALPHIKADSLTFDAFEDYKPQINLMPRISFSFPISDEATFFAHYDVLTQRPREGQVAQFTDYLFILQNATLDVNNPRLRPERTIDFEVGFKQLLTQNIALSIAGYYREMRDMVQLYSFFGGYPISYSSFENLDFSTVKGINVDLDIRRIGVLELRFAYTLQYAQGTGSSVTSSRALIGSIEGFNVFRSLLPLSFDQRHTFTGVADIRFLERGVKGPALTLGGKTIYPLMGAGVNITYNLGSGRPYTRYLLPNPADVQFGVNPVNLISGQPLSNNFPWYNRFDIRVDRDFIIRRGEDKQSILNVYVIFLNAFNQRNVIGVYPYTGLPDDSGYIQSPIGQQLARSQYSKETFEYLYRLKERNPANLGAPLRIRLGLLFSF